MILIHPISIPISMCCAETGPTACLRNRNFVRTLRRACLVGEESGTRGIGRMLWQVPPDMESGGP